MRFLAELFLIALLIWLGWDRSFHALTDQWRGIKPAAATQAQAAGDNTTVPATVPRQPFVGYRRPQVASTPSGQWMWDPAHRGTLDAPATKAGAALNATAPPTANYWIDAQGIRHPLGAAGQPPPPTSGTP